MNVALEPERLYEIVIAVGAVGLMYAFLYWVGSNPAYTTNRGISPEGGAMIVYSVVFFIVVMSAAGLALAYLVSEDVIDD